MDQEIIKDILDGLRFTGDTSDRQLLEFYASRAPVCPNDWSDPFAPAKPMSLKAFVLSRCPGLEIDLWIIHCYLAGSPHGQSREGQERVLKGHGARVDLLDTYLEIREAHDQLLEKHELDLYAYANGLTLEARRQATWAACYARALVDALPGVMGAL